MYSMLFRVDSDSRVEVVELDYEGVLLLLLFSRSHWSSISSINPIGSSPSTTSTYEGWEEFGLRHGQE